MQATDGWLAWIGSAALFGGFALAALGAVAYAEERLEPDAPDPLGTHTVFHGAWLFATVAIAGGAFLVFHLGLVDELALIATAYALMHGIKRLLRPFA
ncbi:MAG: hypothetical protein H6977_17475 [Gammaproteobacteria bacterium]|nr:hypothetical protein [Gammaproteobacteria bacterium]MCP5201790.1 hypothetical protein [Gammaproteobacteria bacterium]